MVNEIRRVIKSGNSVVLTMPKRFLKQKNIKVGDLVAIDKITKVKVYIEEVKEANSQKKLPTQPEVKK